MPRKAPDGNGVIEHRITLGNYERQQLNELADAKKFQLYTSPWASSPVIAAAAIGGIGYLGVAYALDFWPFKPDRKPFFGTALFANTEEQIAGDYGDTYIAEKLASIDELHSANVAYMNANPVPPGSFILSIEWRARQKAVADYPAYRATQVTLFQNIQTAAAERAAAIRETQNQ